MFTLSICSSRRYAKPDECFNHKKCLAWFREYTTPDDPDTLGNNHNSKPNLFEN